MSRVEDDLFYLANLAPRLKAARAKYQEGASMVQDLVRHRQRRCGLTANVKIWNSFPRSSTTAQYVVGLASAIVVAVLGARATAQDTITFLNSWGGVGTGTGQFHFNAGIAVGPTGTVYVADSYQTGNFARVEYFDRTGNYLGSFGTYGVQNLAGQFVEPYGVGTDRSGDVVVADYSGGTYQEFNSTGGTEYHSPIVNEPTDAEFGPNGNLYVVLNGG